jgi:ribosomal protein L23
MPNNYGIINIVLWVLVATTKSDFKQAVEKKYNLKVDSKIATTLF